MLTNGLRPALAGAAMMLATLATPAMAAPNSGGSSSVAACKLSDFSPAAQACSGFFAGNLLSGSKVADQQAGLTAIGFTWDGNFNAVDKIGSLGGSTFVDIKGAFSKVLTGISYVGIHFGKGAGLGSDATAFYKFDAGNGLGSLNLNILNGSSGFVLYATGLEGGTTPPVDPPIDPPIDPPVSNVPEPGTWAMLILGMGMVGLGLRRRTALTVVA